MSEKRVVVVGASSGLGRCIGTGLGQRGAKVALLARRKERLESAAKEAGEGTLAIACDVTDEGSVDDAIAEAAAGLGGIDGLVFTPGIGQLAKIEETDAALWQKVLTTNVIGASIVTAAALPHLKESAGAAAYLSSVSGSETAPWPGLGSYGVSKAALDRLIEVWRIEHPDIAFTRIVVGECGGGEGESMTEFAAEWDMSLAGEFVSDWISRGYMTGAMMDVENLVNTVDTVVRADPSVCLRSVVVAPRLVPPQPGTLPEGHGDA